MLDQTVLFTLVDGRKGWTRDEKVITFMFSSGQVKDVKVIERQPAKFVVSDSPYWSNTVGGLSETYLDEGCKVDAMVSSYHAHVTAV